MKRERLEDLGVINAKLNALLCELEVDWPYFDSKHAYEVFEQYVTKDSCEKLHDLHCRLRFLKDQLWEIWCIARGEDTDE